MYTKAFGKIPACLVAAIITLNTASSLPSVLALPADAVPVEGVRYEFEDGTQNNAEIVTDYNGTSFEGVPIDLSGASGVFLKDKGSVSVTVQIEEAGLYEMILCYAEPFDKIKKPQYLNINGVNQGIINFEYSSEWREYSASMINLNKGPNVIEFECKTGYTLFDYLILKHADESKVNLSVKNQLINPKATNEAKSLMSYLVDIYGTNILSGQQEQPGGHEWGDTEAEFEYISKLTGKLPAIRGFDFMNYRGNELEIEDGSAERLIEWYNKKGGIPVLCWSWFSPGDIGKLGEASYFSDMTTFSISEALTDGTEENAALLADIEFMAGKLKKIQDAGVPVIFRPFREAEESWFWWGKEGPGPCIELYKLLYDKFTHEYNINNLIWEWTSYDYETSAEWYPGNNYVDIIGYIKYNSKNDQPNGSAISSTFYNLVRLSNGEKMIAMSENDTIPMVDSVKDELAAWLYFCTWHGWWIRLETANPVEWIKEMYTSEYCITLDELPELKNYKSTTHSGDSVLYGDINLDGLVTGSDVIPFIYHFLGKELTGQALLNADVLVNGELEVTDLATLKQYCLGDKVKLGTKLL